MKNNKSKELMQKFSIFFVLLVLIIVSSVMNPNFLSHRNITNIAVQLAVATILAYGEMVLIVSGLLDLSSGAVLALSGVLSVSRPIVDWLYSVHFCRFHRCCGYLQHD